MSTVKLEKCVRCKMKSEESSTSYFKRTKDIFNPKPYVCRDCIRMYHALNPDHTDKKKEVIKMTKLETFLKEGNASVPLLQRKFKITHEEAKKVMKEHFCHTT
jgi:hypothetical protein